MQKILLPILIFCTLFSYAQETETAPEVNKNRFNKNIVKLNLFALPLQNFSLQYERGLNRKISVLLGLRLQPKSNLPFKNTILKQLEEADSTAVDFVEKTKVGNWAITPEFRYYFGRKPLNGFYIAPFLRFGGYSLDWDYTYVDDKNKSYPIDFNGRATYYSGGLLFGAQWHIGKHLLIDWWLLGPSYGSMKLNLNGKADLSEFKEKDKQDLEDELNEISKELKIDINNDGAEVKGKLPYAGIRTGLCIGFTF